jgi:hypothetical protein
LDCRIDVSSLHACDVRESFSFPLPFYTLIPSSPVRHLHPYSLLQTSLPLLRFSFLYQAFLFA